MKLEAIGTPLTYRWPGGEVYLEPGKPIDLPEARAQRLLDKAPGKVRVITPTFQPGDTITWQRAGKAQQGAVDFVHVHDDGTHWVFVSVGENWAAVNLKFVKMVTA